MCPKKQPVFFSLPCRISLPWFACHHFVAVVFFAIASPGQSNFHCGDFHSPKAKSGLRCAGLAVENGGGVSELGVDG